MVAIFVGCFRIGVDLNSVTRQGVGVGRTFSCILSWCRLKFVARVNVEQHNWQGNLPKVWVVVVRTRCFLLRCDFIDFVVFNIHSLHTWQVCHVLLGFMMSVVVSRLIGVSV